MELLTIRETAAMLKVAPITIRRYIADGRLAAVRVGKGVRVNKEAAEQLLRPVKPSLDRKHGEIEPVKVFDENDSLFHLIGIAEATDGVTDVSANKGKYLADAFAADRR